MNLEQTPKFKHDTGGTNNKGSRGTAKHLNALLFGLVKAKENYLHMLYASLPEKEQLKLARPMSIGNY